MVIPQSLMEWASRPDPSRRFLGDPRPPAPFIRTARTVSGQVRRATPEWFEGAVFTGAFPLSGKSPPAKRGPKSGMRENTAAAIRQDLQGENLTVDALTAIKQEGLAARYGVCRDTARKARDDVLLSLVGVSTSTNDK